MENAEKRIFISVAEASADIHAAALIRAARAMLPRCRFYGLTGPRMRAAIRGTGDLVADAARSGASGRGHADADAGMAPGGLRAQAGADIGIVPRQWDDAPGHRGDVPPGSETIGDMTVHAAMLGGAAAILARALEMRRRVEAAWRAKRPDLVVLLDSPEFHLNMGPVQPGLAAIARRMGLRVLYYIAPQTWASRPGRNRTIAACVEKLACILPFEEEYFRRHGIDAEFVGHPLFESLRLERPDPRRIAQLRGGGNVVALLPGSREHVIKEVLPLQLQVLRLLQQADGTVRGAVSCAAADRLGQIRALVGDGGAGGSGPCGHPAPEIVVGDNASLLTAADLALVASGTATLHVAHYRKPMIVMYDALRGIMRALYDAIGRRVVTTPHLSLLNILAGARVVPEFMPYVRDTAEVARVAGRLLTDAAWRRLMVAQMESVVAPLEASRASENVCRLIARMVR